MKPETMAVGNNSMVWVIVEIEIDDDRSIPELIDSIRDILQQIGKERSMTVMEMCDKIKYPIDENDDLIDILKRAPMISFNGDRLQFKVKLCQIYDM